MFYPFARSLDDASPVDVGPGERRTGVDFVLRPVPAAAVSGRLTGPPDAVAGRLLRLLPDGSEQLGLGSEHAATTAGPTGEFAFLNVAAGTCLLDTRSATSEFTRGVTTGAPALDPTPGFVPLTGRNQPISARQGVDLVTRIPTRNDAYDGRVRLIVGSEDVGGTSAASRSAVAPDGTGGASAGSPEAGSAAGYT